MSSPRWDLIGCNIKHSVLLGVCACDCYSEIDMDRLMELKLRWGRRGYLSQISVSVPLNGIGYRMPMRRHAPIFLTTRGAVEFNSCQGDDINSELSSTPQGSVRAQHGHVRGRKKEREEYEANTLTNTEWPQLSETLNQDIHPPRRTRRLYLKW